MHALGFRLTPSSPCLNNVLVGKGKTTEVIDDQAWKWQRSREIPFALTHRRLREESSHSFHPSVIMGACVTTESTFFFHFFSHFIYNGDALCSRSVNTHQRWCQAIIVTDVFPIRIDEARGSQGRNRFYLNGEVLFLFISSRFYEGISFIIPWIQALLPVSDKCSIVRTSVTGNIHVF